MYDKKSDLAKQKTPMGSQQFQQQQFLQGAEQTNAGNFMEGGAGGGTPGRSIRGQDAPPNLTNPWASLNSLFKTGAEAYTMYDKLKQEAKYTEQQEELGNLYKKAEEEEWTREKLLTEKTNLVNTQITEDPLWRYRKQQEAASADVAARQWELDQKKIEADEAAAARLDAQRALDEWDQIVGSPVYAPGASTGSVPAQLGGGSTGDVVSQPPNILSGDLESATGEAVEHAIAARYGDEFGSFPPERQKRIRDIYTKQFAPDILRRRRELRAVEEEVAKTEADVAGQVSIFSSPPEFETSDNLVELESGNSRVTEDSWNDVEVYIEAPGAGLRFDEKEARARTAASKGASAILEEGTGTLLERRDQMEAFLTDPRFDAYFGDEPDLVREAIRKELDAKFVTKVVSTAKVDSALLIEEEGINLTPDQADGYRDTQFTRLGLEQDAEGNWIMPPQDTPEYRAVAAVLQQTNTVRVAAGRAYDQRADNREAAEGARKQGEQRTRTQEEVNKDWKNNQAVALDPLKRAIGSDPEYDWDNEEQVQRDMTSAAVYFNHNPNAVMPTEVRHWMTTSMDSGSPQQRAAAMRLFHSLDGVKRSETLGEDPYVNYLLREGARHLTANPGRSNGELYELTKMDRNQWDVVKKAASDSAHLDPEVADQRQEMLDYLSEEMAYGMTEADRSFWEGFVNDTEVDVAKAFEAEPQLLKDLMTTGARYMKAGMDTQEAMAAAMADFYSSGTRVTFLDDQAVVIRDPHRNLDFGNPALSDAEWSDETTYLNKQTEHFLTGRPTKAQFGLTQERFNMTPSEMHSAVHAAGYNLETVTNEQLLRVGLYHLANQGDTHVAWEEIERAEIEYFPQVMNELDRDQLARQGGGVPVAFRMNFLSGASFESADFDTFPSLMLGKDYVQFEQPKPEAPHRDNPDDPRFPKLTPENNPGPITPIERVPFDGSY